LNWGVHREKPVVHSLQLWHGHCRRILMFWSNMLPPIFWVEVTRVSIRVE
jgi:hypothetical protein